MLFLFIFFPRCFSSTDQCAAAEEHLSGDSVLDGSWGQSLHWTHTLLSSNAAVNHSVSEPNGTKSVFMWYKGRKERGRRAWVISVWLSPVSLCIPLHGHSSRGRLKVNSRESVAPRLTLWQKWGAVIGSAGRDTSWAIRINWALKCSVCHNHRLWREKLIPAPSELTHRSVL